MTSLVDRLFDGDKRALARMITVVESQSEEAEEIIRRIYPRTGEAHVIGVTGPPGAGKSTTVDKLAKEYRRRDKTVGIIAVDPSSPFTGGAILGDRVRMMDRALDPNIFIRSLATRGALGGLSAATLDVVRVMDAYGMDVVIIETVGAGQSDVDIVRTADTTIVLHVPGLGDDIQAIKAGIMEIGDVFVVNKADRPGADRSAFELEMMLDMKEGERSWRPPVLKTVARDGEGITEVADAVEEHLEHLHESGEFHEHRQRRTELELYEIVRHKATRMVLDGVVDTPEYESLIEDVERREIDPYTAAQHLLEPLIN